MEDETSDLTRQRLAAKVEECERRLRHNPPMLHPGKNARRLRYEAYKNKLKALKVANRALDAYDEKLKSQ